MDGSNAEKAYATSESIDWEATAKLWMARAKEARSERDEALQSLAGPTSKMPPMGSSEVYNRAYDRAFSTGGKQSDWINAGVQAVANWRDSEVAELTRLLAESRARFANSEARRAELEAVIDKAAGEIRDDPYKRASLTNALQVLGRTAGILSASPSVVLEDRDREVTARAVESVAHDLAEPRVLWWGTYGPQVQTDDATGAKLPLDDWFVERAAAIRKGDNA